MSDKKANKTSKAESIAAIAAIAAIVEEKQRERKEGKSPKKTFHNLTLRIPSELYQATKNALSSNESLNRLVCDLLEAYVSSVQSKK